MSADAPVVDVPASEAPVEAPAAAADVPAEPEVPELYFTFVSSDGKNFKLSACALRQSKTLSDMVSCLALDAETMDPLPIGNIKADTLARIVEWCEHHKDDDTPVEEANENQPRNIEIPTWDTEWLKPENIDNEQLFDLICGANFLNISVLLDYTCKTVANMAKGKSPEELRVVFGILSDEEEEALAKQMASTSVNEPSTSNA